MNCKNCKHWGGDEGDWFSAYEEGFRFCQHEMVGQDPMYTGEKVNPVRPSGVWTPNEGGVSDRLITGPDFGCIHFEQL